MTAITHVAALLTQARDAAGLSQRDLAERAATTQSVVARIELGQGNPTLDTLQRLFKAAGFDLRVDIRPRQSSDALIDAYKRDVDRSLLRENLTRDVTSRLRVNAELHEFTRQARRSVRGRRAR